MVGRWARLVGLATFSMQLLDAVLALGGGAVLGRFGGCLESGPNACRRPLFADKRMAARQVVNAAASGRCSFPRAGGRLGWGSNASIALAKFRPPPQPVLQTEPSQRLGPAAGVLGPQDPSTSGRRPCPREGASPPAARNSDTGRNFTIRNALFLERTLGVGIAAPVKNRAAYASLGHSEHHRRCPRSDWNAVRHHSGTLSAITAECCPGWRGIRTSPIFVTDRSGVTAPPGNKQAQPERRDRHASFGRFYRGKNNRGSNLNGWRSMCRAILA